MERRFGFAVLAIDCLLVETLGAFIEALTDTDRASRQTLCRFLTTRPLLKKAFTTQELATRPPRRRRIQDGGSAPADGDRGPGPQGFFEASAGRRPAQQYMARNSERWEQMLARVLRPASRGRLTTPTQSARIAPRR